MKQDSIRKSFERFLRTRSLKLTPQRARIFERAFATHEHFSAEKLYEWMRGEKGPRVSRATVYRTLGLLQEGGFVESRRGAEGGYRLARPADQITIGEVLRFVEQGKKRRGAPDAFTELWKSVDSAVASILDTTSFAELARRWKESQTRYVPNWEI